MDEGIKGASTLYTTYILQCTPQLLVESKDRANTSLPLSTHSIITIFCPNSIIMPINSTPFCVLPAVLFDTVSALNNQAVNNKICKLNRQEEQWFFSIIGEQCCHVTPVTLVYEGFVIYMGKIMNMLHRHTHAHM